MEDTNVHSEMLSPSQPDNAGSPPSAVDRMESQCPRQSKKSRRKTHKIFSRLSTEEEVDETPLPVLRASLASTLSGPASAFILAKNEENGASMPVPAAQPPEQEKKEKKHPGELGVSSAQGFTLDAPNTSSEQRQADLKKRCQKARTWIALGTLWYFVLGVLALYCISYSNIEWMCIFIICGTLTGALGLWGVLSTTRSLLMLYTVLGSLLLATLFISWCFHVRDLIKALEIYTTSAFPSWEFEDPTFYYDLPPSGLFMQEPWLETAIRQRLQYPNIISDAGVTGSKDFFDDDYKRSINERRLLASEPTAAATQDASASVGTGGTADQSDPAHRVLEPPASKLDSVPPVIGTDKQEENKEQSASHLEDDLNAGKNFMTQEDDISEDDDEDGDVSELVDTQPQDDSFNLRGRGLDLHEDEGDSDKHDADSLWTTEKHDLLQGCAEGAARDPSFRQESMNVMRALTTRGWLCAFSRATALPFHAWPMDCWNKCGYKFFSTGKELRPTNDEDMARVADYLLHMSSLDFKDADECIVYAASTVCTIVNHGFLLIWIIIFIVWILLACCGCCCVAPLSLYSSVKTAQMLKECRR